jgi:hypothetical protein
MMKNKILWFTLLSALLATILAIGCASLITGTFVIDIWIGHSEINSDHEDFDYYTVDMTSNEDWNNHKDDIKRIENVGFQLWITNDGLSTVSGEMYATADTTIYADTTEVKDNATLIFSGLNLAPGKTYVDWATSLGYIKNLSTIRSLVQGGKFTVYGMTTTLPYNVTIDSARVIVTLTAKP